MGMPLTGHLKQQLRPVGFADICRMNPCIEQMTARINQ
jgi:hypothetical protein